MTAKGHILLATGLTGAGMYLLNTTPNIYFIGAVALGSLLPDIDEPNSYIGRKLFFISHFLRFLGVQHRTLSHSILFSLLFLIPGIFLIGIYPYNLILIGLGIGVILHCVGDMLTISGLKYFLFPGKIQLNLLPKPLRFRTGSVTEQVLILFLVAFNIYIFNKLGIIPEIQNYNINIPFLKEAYNYFLYMLSYKF